MGGGKTPWRIEPEIFLKEDIPDVITYFKFGDDRFRGLASAEGQILPFSIDVDGRPYNTLTLPCERVIGSHILAFHCYQDRRSRMTLNCRSTSRGISRHFSCFGGNNS